LDINFYLQVVGKPSIRASIPGGVKDCSVLRNTYCHWVATQMQLNISFHTYVGWDPTCSSMGAWA